MRWRAISVPWRLSIIFTFQIHLWSSVWWFHLQELKGYSFANGLCGQPLFMAIACNFPHIWFPQYRIWTSALYPHFGILWRNSTWWLMNLWYIRITCSQFVDVFLFASWGNIRNKNRPKLKKVGPEVHPEAGDVNEEDACCFNLYGKGQDDQLYNLEPSDFSVTSTKCGLTFVCLGLRWFESI